MTMFSSRRGAADADCCERDKLDGFRDERFRDYSAKPSRFITAAVTLSQRRPANGNASISTGPISFSNWSRTSCRARCSRVLMVSGLIPRSSDVSSTLIPSITRVTNTNRKASGKLSGRSVDKLFAHHLSVRPLLNSYLAHVERTPVGMIDVDAVDNEGLVAGNHVAVANEGAHRLDLRKKVLLESATSSLTNSGWLLIFLHGHVVAVVAVESFQRFSTDELSNQVFNCRLGGRCTHLNLLW